MIRTFSYEPENEEELSLALVFLSAIERGNPSPEEMAASMLRRFATAPIRTPSIEQWTIGILHEVSKDPGPLGLYAKSVAEIIRQRGLN